MESIKENFELINFLSRYSEGVVNKKIKTDSPEIVKVNESVNFVFSRKDETGQQYKYSAKGGINKSFFNDNLLKHFEEEKAKHEGLEKIDFIKAQIEFIDRISEKLKEDYKYILSSLRRLFEEAKQKVPINNLALNQLSDNEINDYRNLLLKESVLVEVGENPNRIGNEKFSASQIIALVIKEISSSKNIRQQTVFEQVKPIWKLTKKELKNYKVPKADNPKLGDYEGFVDSILTKVPET